MSLVFTGWLRKEAYRKIMLFKACIVSNLSGKGLSRKAHDVLYVLGAPFVFGCKQKSVKGFAEDTRRSKSDIN